MSAPLELRDVSVAYNRGTAEELWALRGLTLAVETSDYVSIIGPNGSGKTTLLNTVAGSVTPAWGEVVIRGSCVNRVPEYRRTRSVARVMQDPRQNTCADLTLRENLAMGATRGAKRSVLVAATKSHQLEQALNALELYAPSLTRRLDDPVAALSGGQRQVLALVMAVAAQPSILLLDEHASALDPEVAVHVMDLTEELVTSSEVTTLMVTHNMRQAASYGRRVVIMSRGAIAGQVSGHDKEQLDEVDLIERFRAAVHGEISDRLLSE